MEVKIGEPQLENETRTIYVSDNCLEEYGVSQSSLSRFTYEDESAMNKSIPLVLCYSWSELLENEDLDGK